MSKLSQQQSKNFNMRKLHNPAISVCHVQVSYYRDHNYDGGQTFTDFFSHHYNTFYVGESTVLREKSLAHALQCAKYTGFV